MGPLLFRIYMNVMYAVDTTLVSRMKSTVTADASDCLEPRISTKVVHV